MSRGRRFPKVFPTAEAEAMRRGELYGPLVALGLEGLAAVSRGELRAVSRLVVAHGLADVLWMARVVADDLRAARA